MATDHGAVPPVEHDDTANLRLALMEKWREACGRVADVKADAAVKLYIARETPIPDICARLGLAQKWEEFTGAPCATGTLAV